MDTFDIRHEGALNKYEPLSKLLVSRLITPIVDPYIIPIYPPVRSLDNGSYVPITAKAFRCRRSGRLVPRAGPERKPPAAGEAVYWVGLWV